MRGGDIAMIFQDPMTSLNPVSRSATRSPKRCSRTTRSRATTTRANARSSCSTRSASRTPSGAWTYPHEFSGGMRQRAMIAMAIVNNPDVLIADEPTTALDVTMQAQILEVLKTAAAGDERAMILITHDLGLIAELADRVVVMYAGRVVEHGRRLRRSSTQPRHPYTIGPAEQPAASGHRQASALMPIPGQPPSPDHPPPGCAFHPRCCIRMDARSARGDARRCAIGEGDHLSACHFAEELVEARSSGSERSSRHDRDGCGNDGRAGRVDGRRPQLLRIEGLVKHFPIGGGLLRRQVGAVPPSTASTSPSGEARRSVSWASPAAASRRSARAVMRLARADGRQDRLRGPRHHQAESRARCGRSAARCRSSSRIRTRR